MHTIKTVPPDKAVPPKKTVEVTKQGSPAKSNVKTNKNKNMYLVPDSTVKKNSSK